MMKSLVFAFGLALSFKAFAVGPQITGATGVSNITLPTITGTTVTGAAVIFGGMAGADCSAGGSLATCNSCTVAAMVGTPLCLTAADGLCNCNTTRIYGNLSMTIAVRRGEATTGNIRIAVGTANTVAGTGTGDSVSVTWDDICNKADTPTVCSLVAGNKTINAKIFVDKNGDNTYNATDEASVATDFTFRVINPGEGSYDVYGASTEGIGGTFGFVPYPGDEKVYIEDIEAATNFPTLSYGTKAVKVRVYHSAAGLASANVDSTETTDITVSSDGNTLDRNVVTNGLSNNTTYVFRIAMVDEANNVVQFFPAPAADATCDAGTPFTGCPWAATPEEVLGLLTDDFNCFVATAAYGSFLEPKLKTFRDFKFKILLQNKLGRKFVGAYYKYGPHASRFIYDKPYLRAITRAALWPLYAYSALALKIGFLPATLLSFTLLLMTVAACVFATRFGLRRGLARAE